MVSLDHNGGKALCTMALHGSLCVKDYTRSRLPEMLLKARYFELSNFVESGSSGDPRALDAETAICAFGMKVCRTVHKCDTNKSSGVRDHARRGDRVHGPPMGGSIPTKRG